MRKIAIFTGTRAEYGLLYWIIKSLNESEHVKLQLLVGGMHMSPEFGYTIKQIESDGFPIVERMEFLLASDSPVGISKSMGLALINAAEAIERQKPDIIVLLGDRFESMAIAQAAMIACVPIAHIHGGETTEGLIDEAVRHSITKMSHLHFAATEQYKNRIVQLGEQPERVFNFGAPGIDSIVKLELIQLDELPLSINFELNKPYIMVTYHPVTLESDGVSSSLINLLKVLDEFPEYQLIITYPNADTNGRKLIKILDDYKTLNRKRVLLVKSLGQVRYLSLMKYCEVVIGNSSSGLIEAPSFKVPTVNIGNRQRGRLCGPSVINCSPNKNDILKAIKALFSKEFKKILATAESPYGSGGASEKICKVLETFPMKNLLLKRFHDQEIP